MEDLLINGPDTSSDILTDQVSLEGVYHVNSILTSFKEFNYYHAEFSKGEMVGPLNYYRTTRFRYDEELGKEESSCFTN